MLGSLHAIKSVWKQDASMSLKVGLLIDFLRKDRYGRLTRGGLDPVTPKLLMVLSFLLTQLNQILTRTSKGLNQDTFVWIL